MLICRLRYAIQLMKQIGGRKMHPPEYGRFFAGMLASVLLTMVSAVSAAPPIWDPVFGADTGLVEDDGDISMLLGFNLPFAGNSYNSININTNGGVALGNDGVYAAGNGGYVDYDIWNQDYFESDFTDAGEPLILLFNTDLDNEDGTPPTGTIHFKTDGATTAVVTWDGIASDASDSTPLITFQLTLESDGTISFGYNGIFGDLVDDLGEGIVVGVSNGAGDVPAGSSDLSMDSTGGATPTVYQIWCFDEAPGDPNPLCYEPDLGDNSGFDLDDSNVVFTPNLVGGFDISVLPSDESSGGSFGGSGGGCTAVAYNSRDPLFPALLAVLSTWYFIRRRRRKQSQ